MLNDEVVRPSKLFACSLRERERRRERCANRGRRQTVSKDLGYSFENLRLDGRGGLFQATSLPLLLPMLCKLSRNNIFLDF